MAFLGGLKKLGSTLMPPPVYPYSVRTPPFMPEELSQDETGNYSTPMPPPVPGPNAPRQPIAQSNPPPSPPDVKNLDFGTTPPSAPIPPKPKTAMEEYAEMGGPPVPDKSSWKRQLAAGLLRLAPGVNMTSIPEDVMYPGYRQKLQQYKSEEEQKSRAAEIERQQRMQDLIEQQRQTQERNEQRQERRDQMIDQDRDIARRAAINREYAASGAVRVPESFNLNPDEVEDYTVEQDPMDAKTFWKKPTAAKQARDVAEQKKLADQVNWLPIPKKYQEEFGLPERGPESMLRLALSEVERREAREQNAQLKRELNDANIQARKELQATRPVNNFYLPGMPGSPGVTVGGGGAPSATGAGAQSVLGGEEYLKTLHPGVRNQVQQIIEGDLQLPSANTRSAAGQQLRFAALQADPTLNEQRFMMKKSYRENRQNTPGGSINSLNTVVDHIGVLSQLAEEMKNNPIQAQNKLVNWVKTQLGHPEVTNAAAATNAVANEMERLMRQSGTSEGGIQSFKNGLSLIETSPDQAKGQIATTLKIIAGRAGELANSYQRGMGRDQTPADRKFIGSFLSPQARATLTKFGIKADEMLNIGTAPPPPSGNAGGSAIPTINTKQEYDALPSGAQYIDGQTGKRATKGK